MERVGSFIVGFGKRLEIDRVLNCCEQVYFLNDSLTCDVHNITIELKYLFCEHDIVCMNAETAHPCPSINCAFICSICQKTIDWSNDLIYMTIEKSHTYAAELYPTIDCTVPILLEIPDNVTSLVSVKYSFFLYLINLYKDILNVYYNNLEPQYASQDENQKFWRDLLERIQSQREHANDELHEVLLQTLLSCKKLLKDGMSYSPMEILRSGGTKYIRYMSEQTSTVPTNFENDSNLPAHTYYVNLGREVTKLRLNFSSLYCMWDTSFMIMYCFILLDSKLSRLKDNANVILYQVCKHILEYYNYFVNKGGIFGDSLQFLKTRVTHMNKNQGFKRFDRLKLALSKLNHCADADVPEALIKFFDMHFTLLIEFEATVIKDFAYILLKQRPFLPTDVVERLCNDWNLAIYFDNYKTYMLYKMAKNQYGAVFNPATGSFNQKGSRQRIIDCITFISEMYNAIHAKLLEILDFNSDSQTLNYDFSENKLTFEVLKNCYISDESFPNRLNNLLTSFMK